VHSIYFQIPPQLESHDILYVKGYGLTIRRRSHQIHGSKHTSTVPQLCPRVSPINSRQPSIPVHRPNECSCHGISNRRPRIKINWSAIVLRNRLATYKSRITYLEEGSYGKKLQIEKCDICDIGRE
jgi:hypothetical protein